MTTKATTDPRVTVLLAEFGSALKAEIKMAGRTYSWLADAAREQHGIPLPQSSLSRMLTGQSEPDWSMVEQLLTLCGVDEKKVANIWRPKWQELVKGVQAIKLAETLASLSSPGAPCPTCGAAVLDAALHDAFHADIEARVRRGRLRAAG